MYSGFGCTHLLRVPAPLETSKEQAGSHSLALRSWSLRRAQGSVWLQLALRSVQQHAAFCQNEQNSIWQNTKPVLERHCVHKTCQAKGELGQCPLLSRLPSSAGPARQPLLKQNQNCRTHILVLCHFACLFFLLMSFLYCIKLSSWSSLKMYLNYLIFF